MSRVRASIALLVPVLLIAGCGGSSDPAYAPPTLVNVIADEAIRQPMIYMKGSWDASHQERIVFTFGPTPDMVARVRAGQGGDILVTDDLDVMTQAKTDGVLAADPVAVATNRIVLGVPTESPIASLGDLDGTRWVACTPATSCGVTTQALMEENAFRGHAYQRLEPMEILGRVTSGRAAAGFMWASEAAETAADSLIRTVEVPGSTDNLVTYYIAPLAGSPHSDAAAAFVAFATSAEGKRLIRQGGFTLPS